MNSYFFCEVQLYNKAFKQNRCAEHMANDTGNAHNQTTENSSCRYRQKEQRAWTTETERVPNTYNEFPSVHCSEDLVVKTLPTCNWQLFVIMLALHTMWNTILQLCDKMVTIVIGLLLKSSVVIVLYPTHTYPKRKWGRYMYMYM